MALFWDVSLCIVGDMTQAVSSSETSVIYQTRLNMPDDIHLHNFQRDSHNIFCCRKFRKIIIYLLTTRPSFTDQAIDKPLPAPFLRPVLHLQVSNPGIFTDSIVLFKNSSIVIHSLLIYCLNENLIKIKLSGMKTRGFYKSVRRCLSQALCRLPTFLPVMTNYY